MGTNNTTRIVLSTLRYKSAPQVGSILNVPFYQTSKNIIEYDRSQNIDLVDVFNQEREESTKFRPLAKITFLFKNTYVGETNYKPYYENLYYVNAIDASRQFCSDGINPNNVYWSGYPLYNEFDLMRTDNDTSGYTEPNTNGHIDFISTSASSYNWNFFLSYPFENIDKQMFAIEPITGQQLVWNATNGIPFVINNIVSKGQNYITFRSICKHGLSVGEFVELSFSYNGQNVFQITQLGDGSYNSDMFVFSISNIGYTGNTFSNGVTGTAKRVIDENNVNSTRSEYYIRKHKILTNQVNSVLTNSGFELNPFKVIKQYEPSAITPNNISRISVKEGSQSYNLSFSDNLSLENLIDNQQRPLSEIFFTFQWIGYLGWTSKPTYSQYALKQGFDFNLPLYQDKPNEWWTNDPVGLHIGSYAGIETLSYTKQGSGPTPITFYYNKSLLKDDTIDGDFCEWNSSQYTERIISNIYHKIIYNENVFDINITNESEEKNPLGFYYPVHHPITIRAFSSYIEEGDSNTTSEIPDWSAYDESTQNFIWRDIYPYGFIDNDGVGVDYPFLNGVHYPFKNLIFRLIPEGTTNISASSNTINLPTTDECE
jgi:hypothetical protein